MRYVTLIFALISPIWLFKPLWAEGSLYDESVKYLEENAYCMAVFAALSDPAYDDLRSQLELEVDDEYYSSEAVEQRSYDFAKVVAKQLFTPRGEPLSIADQAYIEATLKDIQNEEYFYIINAWVSNGSLFFDQLYLECVKQINALQ